MASERSQEHAERELDRLIERRCDAAADENEQLWKAGLYAASVRAFHEQEQGRLREQWLRYERHLCEIHQSLADEHKERAKALLQTKGN